MEKHICMTKKILLLLTVAVLTATAAQAHVSLERVLEKQNAEAAQKHAQRQAEITAATGEEEPKTAVCPECGREVPVGTRCSNHHKPFLVTANENTEEASEDSSTWVCPECGREVPVNEKTCSHGHKAIAFSPSYIKKELPALPQDLRPAQARPHYVAKTPVTSHGPRCPECGRTPEEVKIHGHNHK